MLVTTGCEQSHTRHSSGSNWLRCDTLADCRAAEQAVACDAEGFCTDDAGDRIAVVADDAGGREPSPEPAPDAGGPERTDASVRAPCAWGVDGLLAQVGAAQIARTNCGDFNGSDSAASAAARDCFERAVGDGVSVQVTINRCIDCSIPTTYVAAASGERFAFLMEQDHFGADGMREAKVEACEDIVFIEASETIDLSCVAPTELYTCTEAFDAPLGPYKLGDVPAPVGTAGVPLHLYVSNQSVDRPLVEINVYIDGAYVVTGDFDVGGQHNWYEFEIAVPPGSLSVRAIMPEGSAQLDQEIEVPAERWAVLDYWFSPGEPEGEHFTLAVHDQPVTFQ